MNKWIFLFRSPDGQEGGSGLESIVSDAVNDDSGAGGDSGAGDQSPAAAAPPAGDTPGADKGTQGNQSGDDSEIELDFEAEAGKGKHKMKMSEIKSHVKWLFENRVPIASSMKVRELAGKYPEFSSVLTEVLSKSFNDKGELNKDFIGRVAKSFEAKVEQQQQAIETKIDDKDENIEQMEKMLEELEADSPQAKILQGSIKNQKALRTQLIAKSKELTDALNGFNSRLAGIEKQSGDFIKQQENSKVSAEVKAAADLFNKTLSEVTDQKIEASYKFIDQDEKAIFEGEVRNIVANSADKVKDDAGYVKLIRDAVKAVQDKYGKRREAIIADYLRKKGKEVSGNPPIKPKEEKIPAGDISDQLGSLISEATEEHLAGQK